MTRRGTLLLSLLLVLMPVSAAGQDYVGQIWNQLRETETGNPGFEVHHYLIATLEHGDTYGFTTTLSKGLRYIVVAACDQDCTDVDLRVRDDAGTLVASDTAVDDRPQVSFVPDRTGKFAIEVEMITCAEDFCYFGFGILD